MTSPRRALIVIDVQNEYFDGKMRIQYPPREQTLANIARMIDHAEAHSLPIAVIQHSFPADAPVYAEGSHGWELHPDVASRVKPHWKRVTKSFGSVFGGTDVLEWLQEHDVDTITVAGYMTNNCDLATVAEAEVHGLNAEVVSDATGAIHIVNAAGKVSAEQVHTTLLAIFNSNFAAVAVADDWLDAVSTGSSLDKDNLIASAEQGRNVFGE